MNYSNFLFLLVAITFFTCCNKPKVAEVKKDKGIDSVLILNDVADFIAGKDVRKGSEFYALSQSEAWKKYHEESEKAWKDFDKQATRYKYFTQKKLSQPFDTLKTLFYPFSGPDFLFANLFFPKVDKMVLIGLETPGSVPVFKVNEQDSLNKIFNLYRQAISDVVQLSFFRTVDMAVELENKAIDGTTPILMLFLARSNKEILSVEKSVFTDAGEPVRATGNKPANAVVINYRDKGTVKTKSIVYISVNLADPSLRKSKGILQYLKNMQGPTLTFVKSATYLMHKPYFSEIRNICLNKSAIILQDDSGISFHYFKKDQWKFNFYGSYSKPIDMFNMYYQEDYSNAFKNANPEPLFFRVGYNRNSNLLLAVRK